MTTPLTDTDRIAAAQAYIDALVSHDADGVPFAPDCTRVEVGVKTGFSGDHLRRSLNRGLQYRVIQGTTGPEFSVTGDEVRARFDLVTKPVLVGRRVGAHIDETFIIRADASGRAEIHHIRAGIRPHLTRQARRIAIYIKWMSRANTWIFKKPGGRGGDGFRCGAREATNAERDEYWPKLDAMYPDFVNYRSYTDRQIPIIICDP